MRDDRLDADDEPEGALPSPDLELDDLVDVDVSVVEPWEARVPRPAIRRSALHPVPPDAVPREGPIVGIDLGTTNCCVAAVVDGRARVLPSREGYATLPSVVALTEAHRLLVGHPARAQMLTNPRHTVYGAKRLVGRDFESATVRAVGERFQYEVCADDAGKAAVRLGDDVFSLEEVQALILRECKDVAQGHLGRPVHRAVVTVPAYYSDVQRQAVREAGRLAGLWVERIVNEPTAAALAFGMGRQLDRRVLIYDLGGGTFDATAMSIQGNAFEVLATGGDTFLGGADFDAQLVDWLLERFEETTGRPFDGGRAALARVADAAERAKIALSESRVHRVHVPFLTVDEAGQAYDLACEMRREDLEAMTAGLVDRTVDVVRDVLLDANLKPSDVDEIVLVGGQSRMPLVRHRLRELFGRDAHPGVHPDEAVALGAAQLAASLERPSGVVLVDVVPMTLGVGLPGGRFKRIVERNTPLPVRKTYGLATTRDDQAVLELSVFQGEDAQVAANEYLGTVRLEGLPKGPRGTVRLAVTFEMGPECVLSVYARELGAGREVTARLATRDTPAMLRRRLGLDEAAARSAQASREAELERRAGRFWRLVRRVIGRS